MTDIRLIALDLDDTLLNNELQITVDNFQAIQAARKAGVKVMIATGRMYRSALPYAQELGLELPLVTYHGALVKERDGGAVLAHRPVPLEIAREIAEEAEQLGYHLNAYEDDQVLVKEATEEGKYYSEIANVRPKVVGSLVTGLTLPPTKLLLINQEERLAPLLTKWQQQYKDVLMLTKSKPNFLEITATGVHKGFGVEFVAQNLGLNAAQVMAIGDSYNDLAMFNYAGLSVAMENSVKEVQEQADFVTCSNQESGVGAAIRMHILQK